MCVYVCDVYVCVMYMCVCVCVRVSRLDWFAMGGEMNLFQDIFGPVNLSYFILCQKKAA